MYALKILWRLIMSSLIFLEVSVSTPCHGIVHQAYLPAVVQSISRFANNTLSALYYDITKDVLYANKIDSVERRAVALVLEEVSFHFTHVIYTKRNALLTFVNIRYYIG